MLVPVPLWVVLAAVAVVAALASAASCEARRSLALALAADVLSGAAGFLFTASLVGVAAAAALSVLGFALWLVGGRVLRGALPLNLALAPALVLPYLVLLRAVRSARGAARAALVAATTMLVYSTPMIAMLASLWALKMVGYKPGSRGDAAAAELRGDYAALDADAPGAGAGSPEPWWVSVEPPAPLRMLKLRCEPRLAGDAA